jgi:predicted site-specific integrase-resolvase
MIKNQTPKPGTRIYGYARVSAEDQDLAIQQAALEAAGCMTVFVEAMSGIRRGGRSERQVLLEYVREGDTVIVTRIDRLAGSMKDLQDIVHDLKQKGVALKATEQPIDTGSAAGKAFYDMLEVFAEFETSLRHERQFRTLQRRGKKASAPSAVPRTAQPDQIVLKGDRWHCRFFWDARCHRVRPAVHTRVLHGRSQAREKSTRAHPSSRSPGNRYENSAEGVANITRIEPGATRT